MTTYRIGLPIVLAAWLTMDCFSQDLSAPLEREVSHAFRALLAVGMPVDIGLMQAQLEQDIVDAAKTNEEERIAQAQQELEKERLWPFRHRAKGTRIQELPAHITAPDGEFSVFADFDHPRKDGIPLYLINGSIAPIELNCQGGYLKLEYCDDENEWRRAEPHRYSWCGNSYSMLEIPPRTFIVDYGHRAEQGKKRMVRYRFYDQSTKIASNIGEGFVDERDVFLASRDAMSPPDWPLDQIERVALGEEIIPNELDHCDLRFKAIMALTSDRFSAAKRGEILKRLRDQKDAEYSFYADHVERRLEKGKKVECGMLLDD